MVRWLDKIVLANIQHGIDVFDRDPDGQVVPGSYSGVKEGSGTSPVITSASHSTSLTDSFHSQSKTEPPKLSSVRILKRLPRGSRECAAWKLTSILNSVIADIDDISAWSRLLHFSSKCFQQPRRGGHNRSLASG